MGLSDTGYGLWVGTSVNDTSSVIAAGYAFLMPRGSRHNCKTHPTLFIVPIVLVFSWIYTKKELQKAGGEGRVKVEISKIFPRLSWLLMVESEAQVSSPQTP